MKNSILAAFLVLLLSNFCLSQNSNEIWYNSVSIPPSPNASSLGKYAEYPVDKSTGALGITIPLLSISEDEIEIPISIDYHGSGIKVQDESSIVGLGWSLNCGGVITRVMNGKPDERGFLRDGSIIPRAEIIDRLFQNQLFKMDMYTWLYQLYNNTTDEDFEPDVFSFNINGLSGTFYFGNDGRIRCIPEKDFTITPIFNIGLKGFRIDDQKGNIYLFGNVFGTGYIENTVTESATGGGTTSYSSSFYICKIINPLKETSIQFYYKTYPMADRSIQYSSSMIYKQYFGGNYVLESNTINSTTNGGNNLVLSKIKTSLGEINFYSSLSDEDLPKIDSISFNNQVFLFNYSYFEDGTPRERDNTRLKLNEIKEVNTLNNTSKNHTFEYSHLPLPSKSSTALDFWGYYNGKNNMSLTPKYKVGGQVLGEADRNVDTNYTQAAILKKITYPTKGSSEFTYENNTYSDLTNVEDIKEAGPEFIITSTGVTGWQHCNTSTISFAPGYTYFNARLSCELEITNMNNYLPEENFGTVTVYNTNGEIEFVKDIEYGHEWIENIFEGISFDSSDQFVVEVCGEGLITIPKATLTFEKYNSQLLNTPIDRDGGGLRIKKIKSFNQNNGNPITVKEFDYNRSGYLTTTLLPGYSQTFVSLWYENVNSIIYERRDVKLHLFSTPPGGLGSAANSVAYEKVSEIIHNGNQINGKTITHYMKKQDPTSAGALGIPKRNYSYVRSLVKKEEIFGAENLNDTLKIVENFYIQDVNRGSTIEGFKCNRKVIDERHSNYNPNLPPFPYNHTDWFYTNYIIENYPYLLEKVINTERRDNGILKTEENYFYESNRHMGVTKKILFDGKDYYTTKFYYPADFSTCSENCETQYNENKRNCLEDVLGSYYFDEISSLNAIRRQSDIIEYNCLRECYETYPNGVFLFDYLYGVFLNNCIRNCSEQSREYLTANNYYSTIQQLGHPFPACAASVDSMYNECLYQFNNCLLSSYNNAPDEYSKALVLLNTLNYNKILIEKKSYKNNELIDHQVFKWGIEKRLNNIELPILKQAELLDVNSSPLKSIFYKYDNFGNITEMKIGNNGMDLSYVYGYLENFPIAETKNTTTAESGYTGFENEEYNSFKESGYSNCSFDTDAFTGTKSMKVSNGYGPTNSFKVGLNANNHSGYKASVWVKGSTDAYLHIEVDGQWSTHARMLNNEATPGWHLLEVELPKAKLASFINGDMRVKVYIGTNGGTAYFDDVRFHPMDAQMTSYTYKPLVGMTSSSDANNKPTLYEYDGFGRLVLVKDFLGNILKKNEYHYND